MEANGLTQNEIIKLFDYKFSRNPIESKKTLRKLKNRIPSHIKNFQAVPKNFSILEAKNESEEFMKSHFRLHNIYYTKDNQASSFKLIDPYQLPIEENNEENNCVESTTIIKDDENLKNYYKRIKIKKDITEFTPKTITHEITHTQLDNDILKYYNNHEFLPILLEIIHEIEKSSLNKKQLRTVLRRTAYLIKEIDSLGTLLRNKAYLASISENYSNETIESDIIEYSVYIESTLKALNLSEIYKKANENIRKEIRNYIQNVIDANRSVEDFLDFYEITFRNSVTSLQKKFKWHFTTFESSINTLQK